MTEKFTEQQIMERKIELGLVGLENYVPSSKGSFKFIASSHSKEQEIQQMANEIYNEYQDKEKAKYLKGRVIKRHLCHMIKKLIKELQNYEPEEHDDYNIMEALEETQVYDLFHFAEHLDTYSGRDEYYISPYVLKIAYIRLVQISGCSPIVKFCQCPKCR